jgi:putative FmdB family regulatory protein
LPIYEYRCENGHVFEVMQSMSEEPVSTCPTCGASVERVFHPVAVHFKGSGFYSTDYGRNRGGAGAKDESKDDSKADSKTESKTEAAATKSNGSSSSTSSSDA